MKIGLFGGTFDPIHWGHLRSAEEVCEAFALDKVLFIPAAYPPHKTKRTGAPARDRLNMVRLAVAGNPRFAISTVELSRPGKSYSIDTLQYFAGRSASKDSLYFILGLDAFVEIHLWKRYRELFPLCHMIVTSRPGSGASLSLKKMPIVIQKLFCYDSRESAYRHASGSYLFFLRLTDIAISATDIRTRLGEGRSIRYLVPDHVERYIKRKRLYASGDSQ
jgi:nicotinate-nucleotide adenylyltransferase